MLFVLRHILPFFCPWTWEETLNELSMCFFQTTVKEFKTKIADEMVKCVGFNSVLYCFVVVYMRRFRQIMRLFASIIGTFDKLGRS
jgi:uncharacterized protein YjeT (DUF2065 family)